MPDLAVLQPFIDEDPSDFAALDAACGKFIDAWLAEGGEPTDDEVVGFYSLWSQSMDAKFNDESGFYNWAYPLFVECRDGVRSQLKQA